MFSLLHDCTIKGGTWKAQLQLRNCSNVTIDGIEMTGTGVNAWLNVVGGTASTLTPGNNIIQNCKFHDMDNIVACQVAGCGNTIQNNLAYNLQGRAFQASGPLQTVTGNEAYACCTATDDCGALYCAGGSPDFGTVFSNNYVHDVQGRVTDTNIYGLYMDNHMSACTVSGNTFEDIKKAGVFVNGGRDNTLSGNTFRGVFGTAGILIADRSNDAWPPVSAFGNLLLADFIAQFPHETSMTASTGTISGISCYTADFHHYAIGNVVDSNGYGSGVTLLSISTFTGLTASTSTTRSATNVQYTNNFVTTSTNPRKMATTYVPDIITLYKELLSYDLDDTTSGDQSPTDAQVIVKINRAKDVISKLLFQYDPMITFTPVASQLTYNLRSSAVVSKPVVRPMQVIINKNPLRNMTDTDYGLWSQLELARQYPTYRTDPAATPIIAAYVGNQQLILYPPPTSGIVSAGNNYIGGQYLAKDLYAPTTVTTGATSATQQVGSTNGMAAGDTLYFATAAVEAVISSVTDSTHVVLASSITTTTSEAVSIVPDIPNEVRAAIAYLGAIITAEPMVSEDEQMARLKSYDARGAQLVTEIGQENRDALIDMAALGHETPRYLFA